MTTATDEAGLLAAVLLRPDDDLPRLVYADWLDENGRPERAEFVRVQVELARTVDPDGDEFPTDWPAHLKSTERRLYLELRERERELWATSKGLRPIQHPCQWFDVPGWACLADVGLTRIVWTLPDYSEAVADVSRGFVSAVSLTLGAFLGEPCENCDGFGEFTRENSDGPPGPCPDCGGKWNSGPHLDGDSYWDRGTGRTEGVAARLFAAHPVERVTLSCREPQPQQHTGRYGWKNTTEHAEWFPSIPLADRPYHLPGDVWWRMSWNAEVAFHSNRHWAMFPTREAALAALSDACVAYGRERANLTNGGER